MKKTLLSFLSFLLLTCWGVSGINTSSGDFKTDVPSRISGKNVGKVEALVILINFADRTPTFAQADVDSFFNQVGYNKYTNKGSIRDYWASVSQNRIDVHTNVTKTYFQAPKTFAYYDTDGGSGHTHELLDAALDWLEGTGFDFSKLSVDANKNIIALSFQFVGNSGQKGLWGHSSGHGRTFDGVNTASYQISELGTTNMRKGGICHEQGHMLFGWPDTYDTNGDNGGSSGCGKFDLMAAGNSDNSGSPSANPMPPNPYFRYLAGWNDLIPLNSFPNDTTLKIIANKWNTYVYRNPEREGEMYIIEARKKPYSNVDMPGEGVLVWHIDSIISGNTNQHRTEELHYKVSVVQADNAYHLESGSNSGDANDYFKAGGTSNITYTNTRWWNSAYSGLMFRNISSVKDTMTASFGSANRSDVSIKTSSTKGGKPSPYGLKYYALNSSQVVLALPSKNFEVEDCKVDGVSQGPVTNYAFTGISAPHTLDYSFIHKAVPLKDILAGVNYSYYEGSWSSMPDFSKLTALKTGRLNTLSLNIANRASNNFGIHFTGYINVPTDGEYTFYLTSDDGSRFLIDGVEIVANQCNPETSGKLRLRAGYHPFTFDFFEGQVTESFMLKWQGPNLSKRYISGFATGAVDNSNTALSDITDDTQADMYVTPEVFSFNCPGNRELNIEVYTLSGILVAKQKLYTSDGLVSMSNTNLKTGLYIVKVNAGTKTILRQKASIVR